MLDPYEILYYAAGWILVSALVIAAACALWMFLVYVIEDREADMKKYREDQQALDVANRG